MNNNTNANDDGILRNLQLLGRVLCDPINGSLGNGSVVLFRAVCSRRDVLRLLG